MKKKKPKKRPPSKKKVVKKRKSFGETEFVLSLWKVMMEQTKKNPDLLKLYEQLVPGKGRKASS